MKYFIFILLSLTLTCGSLYAQYCPKCGSKLVCPKCNGIHSNHKEDHSSNTQIEKLSKINESFLNLFEPINKFEIYLKTSNYLTTVAKSPEFRIKFKENNNIIEKNLSNLSKAAKKLNYLYQKKNKLIELALNAWNDSIYGSLKITAKAQKGKYIFSINALNDMIKLLIEKKNSLSILSKIDKLEKKLDKQLKEYTVRSKFIKLKGALDYWIAKGQSIWVMEIKNKKARVMHMGEPTGLTEPIVGWTTLKELRYRTTWKK